MNKIFDIEIDTGNQIGFLKFLIGTYLMPKYDPILFRIKILVI